MKKLASIFYLFFFICCTVFASETKWITIRSKNENKYFGTLVIEQDKIFCCYEGSFRDLVYLDSEILNDSLIVYFNRFEADILYENENNIPKYLTFHFPKKYSVSILRNSIENCNIKEIVLDTSKTYPTTCQAIIIDNLTVREKPCLEGKKIGRIEKRTEVTLYEQSENIDEIDGEKNPWYKIKLADSKEGWVYGGYVRIFFEGYYTGFENRDAILNCIN